MIIFTHTILTIEQERVLIYRFIRKRCLWSVYKLIFSYVKMVFKISHKFSKFNNINFSDIYNEGLVGFINAVLLYNPEKNNKIMSFSFFWVNFFILNYIKKYVIITNKNDFYTKYNNRINFEKNKSKSNVDIHCVSTYFYNYEGYYIFYKIKSAICNLLPTLQIVVFSCYIFHRSLSLEELSFFLNTSLITVRRLKKNTLNVLYILSM